MNHPSSIWPSPADLTAALWLRTEFAALGAAEAAFAQSPEGAALLAALGGNAPYLAELAIAESATLLAAHTNPQEIIKNILDDLRKTPLDASRAEVGKRLRIAKRQAALTIALADISGRWNLVQVTSSLSDLAEVSLTVAIRHLLRSLHDQGSITLPIPTEPDRKSGFVALALGKLGAGELNYSSDIDLVLLYDPQNPVYPLEA
ncbi:MAG TPA: glutamate-ammonia-ligase adenylyltransferase, partial [Acetobacteraceae bacterium]|nr:glutamate-ammonia-ligase adenylyltransferase [Acetobacteraceae bacterium]